MRTAFRWTFGLSIAATLISLIWLDPQMEDAREAASVAPALQVAESPHLEPLAAAFAARSSTAPSSESSYVSLPQRLRPQLLSAAQRNPFGSPMPPPALEPIMKPVQPVAPTQQTASATEAPKAPVAIYRFVGQMVDPAGLRVVYLSKADKELRAMVSTRLDDGYVIEAITATAVKLLHTETDTRVDIGIPASPGTVQ